MINLPRPCSLYNVVSFQNSGFVTKGQLHADHLLSSRCWLSPRHALLILSRNHLPIYPEATQEVSRGPSLCFEQAFLQLLLKNWHKEWPFSQPMWLKIMSSKWNWQDTQTWPLKTRLTQSSHQFGTEDVLWTGYCKVLLRNQQLPAQGPPRQSSVLSCDMHAHCCEDEPTMLLSKLLTTRDLHLL